MFSGGYSGRPDLYYLGLHHTAYHITIEKAIPHLYRDYFPFEGLLFVKVIIASVAFGMASWLFAISVHGVKDAFNKFIAPKWAIPALGGVIIIALTFIIGKPDYLSLGVDAEYPGAITIQSAFNPAAHIPGAGYGKPFILPLHWAPALRVARLHRYFISALRWATLCLC
ncbi:chloride channel protein [Mucilaginibacter antarcticus]|uniref:chloride channel protein n=1 Tax=Mucilaginibacter antarcticus TaxID=1855725 RepID=UPI003624BE4C